MIRVGDMVRVDGEPVLSTVVGVGVGLVQVQRPKGSRTWERCEDVTPAPIVRGCWVRATDDEAWSAKGLVMDVSDGLVQLTWNNEPSEAYWEIAPDRLVRIAPPEEL